MTLSAFMDKYGPVLEGLQQAQRLTDPSLYSQIRSGEPVGEVRRPFAEISFDGIPSEPFPTWTFYPEENRPERKTSVEALVACGLEEGLWAVADYVGNRILARKQCLINAKELHARVCDELPAKTA